MDYRKSVYCVLKTGQFKNGNKPVEYNTIQVQWLKKQCDEYLPGVDFYCLTDVDKIEGVNTISLIHDWPGWWSKIELFRFDDVFYLDLDTVILNDIRYMLNLEGFYALRNLSKHKRNGKIVMGSGIMSWSGSYRHVYDNFDISIIGSYKTHQNRWGDQGYIHEQVNYKAIQDEFPNKIHSYKFDGIDKKNPPSDIVVFHGKPKPWDSGQDWVPPLVP
jgi:hypothetical protein